MLLVKVFSTTRPSVSMSKMADTEALEEIGFPKMTKCVSVELLRIILYPNKGREKAFVCKGRVVPELCVEFSTLFIYGGILKHLKTIKNLPTLAP